MPIDKKDLEQLKQPNDSVLGKIIRIFRTNNVVRHHFQSPGFSTPVGTVKSLFKNVFNYSMGQNLVSNYSSADRSARYGDYSEMESHPILGNALNIVADEVTQKDENGNIVTVFSKNGEIKKILQQLIDNVLHLNGKSIWKLARNLIKYGDVFFLIDINESQGIVNLIQMPANEVEREEGFDSDEPGAVRFRWITKQNIQIPNAFVAHFRLEGNDIFHPYGMSILEPARRPWRQLVLLTDAMMVYRISRAPERRVFKVDMASIDPQDRENVLKKFNEELKKQKVTNEAGKIDLRYGASLAMDADYVLPVLGKDNGTSIETLPGGQNLGDIEDIEFIRQDLFAALGIPKAFLTFDQDVKSKQVLTQEDIRFARTVARIQDAIINELIKICMIHLYIKGHRGEDLVDFSIRMSSPSTVGEMQKAELWRARMDLVNTARDGVFDTEFIYKHFLRLSDEQIDKIRKGQIRDKIYQAKLLQIENSQGQVQATGIPGGLPGGIPAGIGSAPPGATTDLNLGAPAGNEQPQDIQLPMPQGGAPPTVIPTESKNLWRSSDGNSRKLQKRGLDGINISEEDPDEDDVYDQEGIRRTIASPMGGRESAFDEAEEQLAKIYIQEKKEEYKSSFPLGFSEEVLTKTFGEDVGADRKGLLKEQFSTYDVLAESAKIASEKVFDALFDGSDISDSEKSKQIEENVNKILVEVIKTHK
jgi:hypothetical protein